MYVHILLNIRQIRHMNYTSGVVRKYYCIHLRDSLSYKF